MSLPATQRRPGLLIRTPYGRQQYRDDSMVAKAVERGYAVVVQDVRGRYESAGTFDPYKHEGHDGFDTIEWIAAQPWSNGRVATAGLSYPGAVQWLAAVETPPHLACAFPAMCFSSARQFFYFGGAFDLSWLPWTANNIAPGRPAAPQRQRAADRPARRARGGASTVATRCGACPFAVIRCLPASRRSTTSGWTIQTTGPTGISRSWSGATRA